MALRGASVSVSILTRFWVDSVGSLRAVKDSSAESLLFAALEETAEGTRVMSDEWGAYRNRYAEGRPHGTVNHGKGECGKSGTGYSLVASPTPFAPSFF